MSRTAKAAASAVLTVLLCSACCLGQDKPKTDEKPVAQSTDEMAETALDKAVIKDMSFKNTPLGDVVDFLRQVGGQNVVANWTALNAAGIEESTKVNVDLKAVSLRQALEMVLRSVSAVTRVDYAVKDGVLIISTADDLHLPSMLQTRVYDVKDLTSVSDPCQADVLVRIIRENVDPDGWRPMGDTGTLNYFNGLLLVTQTYRNHRALADLLDKIRKAGPETAVSPRAQAQQSVARARLVTNLKETCADPQAMSIIAVGGLRSEVSMKREDLIRLLNDRLSQAKSRTVRNAIRLTLKDLYMEAGDAAKVIGEYNAILADNDVSDAR